MDRRHLETEKMRDNIRVEGGGRARRADRLASNPAATVPHLLCDLAQVTDFASVCTPNRELNGKHVLTRCSEHCWDRALTSTELHTGRAVGGGAAGPGQRAGHRTKGARKFKVKIASA